MNSEDLRQALLRIDGRPYPTYKDIKGRYDFGDFELSIDRIQGDPFAAPSRFSLLIKHVSSGIPSDLFSNRSRKLGSETYLAKSFASLCRKHRKSLGSGKSGLISIDTPGQEILERTCVTIDESQTTLRFSIGLPANGRRILGRFAANLLCDGLKRIALTVFDLSDSAGIRNYAEANEDADALRKQLEEHRLVAFIADGSILPRATGIDQRPLENAISFESPSTLRIQLETPNRGTVSGMGIGDGITLIVGGGYHGKSTLLNAIERGVYNHIPGDGRERIVSRSDATKVRAEDGRSVASVDLSPFINNLPGGKDTVAFSTDNASGSTSQAASIIETLETEAHCLLIDDDISATNFLIRDDRMQKLIAPDKEPITPFVQRVRPFYDQHGVSTILVLGGSGDYFEPAHRVIAMDNFLPVDLTAQAKALCSNQSAKTDSAPIKPIEKRTAIISSISPFRSNKAYRDNRNSRPPKRHIKARDRRTLEFGTETIDLSLQSQIVDSSQTRTIGAVMDYARQQGYFDEDTITSTLQRALNDVSQQGLSLLEGNDLAAIRLQELSAALNRLRSLRIMPSESID